MKMFPEYAQNIIVAVIYKGELTWYVTDKDIWYLDYRKRLEDFKKNGYTISLDYMDDTRKDLLVVDTSNVMTFKEKIRQFEVTTTELREYVEQQKQENDEWYYDCSPSLYINFDAQVLYSAYREMSNYEDYAPQGWKSEFAEFLGYIPLQNCYWLDDEITNFFIEEDAENGE